MNKADIPESFENMSEKKSHTKDTDALQLAHGIHSTRLLLQHAEKEGVDIEQSFEKIDEQLAQYNETEPELQRFSDIVHHVNACILKLLAEAGVNIPPALQDELENGFFGYS